MSNLVKNQGYFQMPSNKLGASYFTVQGLTSLVNILITYNMLSVKSAGKVQLLVQSQFSATLLPTWDRAWNKAPALTTGTGGYGEGS